MKASRVGLGREIGPGHDSSTSACQESSVSQHEQWQISGNAPEVYERYLVPTLFTPWATDLIARLPLHAGEHVLDVACGTGSVARLAAHRVSPGGTVTGLDLNPDMLAVARSLPHVPGVRVDWREGSAMALPFANAVFNVVLCQQGAAVLSGPLAALREMHRVLVPGGRLGLSVWRPLQHNHSKPCGRLWPLRWNVPHGAIAGGGRRCRS
jgi:ubiquinone/menaquinone biosynthesis C-methylase UbiE